MTDLVRQAPLGQAIRWITGNLLLQYPEERPGFELPTQYLTKINSEKRRQSILSPVTMKTSGQIYKEMTPLQPVQATVIWKDWGYPRQKAEWTLSPTTAGDSKSNIQLRNRNFNKSCYNHRNKNKVDHAIQYQFHSRDTYIVSISPLKPVRKINFEEL
ncbi:hypothetical protein HYFRA_00007646 [Hymenoscyphus fraxineus]|uniref:Uncharacterized protein n=1 Tax=Hymenoscyphus fraxineus TaxID=746836 RepID=A0A9N9KSU4_9HELO|nr:hypothetical protein HYFRA_00007646 [Hymenoscyphus fraxineus]